MAEHLLLVGMMGTGKSTVGRLVAARLGRPVVDTDDVVEQAAGTSVAAIFATSGEAAFRRREAEALQDVLACDDACVVSVGGGAVLDPTNRAAMRRAGTVVWLRARPDTLEARVGDDDGRPLLSGVGEGVAGALVRIDAERRPLYDELADEVVDVDGLDPDEVADRVLAVTGRAVRAQRDGR